MIKLKRKTIKPDLFFNFILFLDSKQYLHKIQTFFFIFLVLASKNVTNIIIFRSGQIYLL